MKKSLILLAFTASLIACSGPLDKKYDEDTYVEDGKEIKESAKLSDEDAKTMFDWILRAKLKGESLEGKTYGEILDEAKVYKKEQEKLAEKVKRELE